MADMLNGIEHLPCKAETFKLVTLLKGARELLTRCLETGSLLDAELLDHIRSWFEQLNSHVAGENTE